MWALMKLQSMQNVKMTRINSIEKNKNNTNKKFKFKFKMLNMYEGIRYK